MMKKMNKAFTLTELLVALGVIAVLCAILLPVIMNILPNQNVVMAKRAYYTIKTVVSELINDEACYPDRTSASNDVRVGFDDEFGYPNCQKWGVGDYNLIEKGGDRVLKFTTLFFDRLGAGPLDNCTSATTTTSDDIVWFCSSENNFAPASGVDGFLQLHVDVNGAEGPNCSDTAFGSVSKCEGVGNYDRFSVKIYTDGKIEIMDPWVKDAVKITKDLTE